MGGGGEERRDLWPSTRALCVDKKKKKKKTPIKPKTSSAEYLRVGPAESGKAPAENQLNQGHGAVVALNRGPEKGS